MTRSKVVLPAPFGPIRPVNSPRRMLNETSRRICRAAQLHSDAVQPEQVGRHHRCSVETLLVTAFCRAWTSASIHDW